MAKRVHEIMNRELFSVLPTTSVEDAVGDILALGITAAPVLDERRAPVGIVSLRDLVGSDDEQVVGDCMTTPVATAHRDTTIEQTARELAHAGVHHLVAVDDDGLAVGVVSSLDVIRSMLDLPVSHPPAFPHLERETGLSWSDDAPLAPDAVEQAPNGPGLMLLTRGAYGQTEGPVWVESVSNLRTRLSELVSIPQEDRALARLLEREHQHLRFRTAPLRDPERRQREVERLRASLRQTAAGTPPT